MRDRRTGGSPCNRAAAAAGEFGSSTAESRRESASGSAPPIKPARKPLAASSRRKSAGETLLVDLAPQRFAQLRIAGRKTKYHDFQIGGIAGERQRRQRRFSRRRRLEASGSPPKTARTTTRPPAIARGPDLACQADEFGRFDRPRCEKAAKRIRPRRVEAPCGGVNGKRRAAECIRR